MLLTDVNKMSRVIGKIPELQRRRDDSGRRGGGKRRRGEEEKRGSGGERKRVKDGKTEQKENQVAFGDSLNERKKGFFLF